MGSKSRGNYAPGFSLTQKEFDNIFKKEADDGTPIESRQANTGTDHSKENDREIQEDKAEERSGN